MHLHVVIYLRGTQICKDWLSVFALSFSFSQNSKPQVWYLKPKAILPRIYSATQKSESKNHIVQKSKAQSANVAGLFYFFPHFQMGLKSISDEDVTLCLCGRALLCALGFFENPLRQHPRSNVNVNTGAASAHCRASVLSWSSGFHLSHRPVYSLPSISPTHRSVLWYDKMWCVRWRLSFIHPTTGTLAALQQPRPWWSGTKHQ